jgi:hypothetical protein
VNKAHLHGWICCRLDPSCEDLVAVCGSLPNSVAAMAAALPLLPVLAPKASSN